MILKLILMKKLEKMIVKKIKVIELKDKLYEFSSKKKNFNIFW